MVKLPNNNVSNGNIKSDTNIDSYFQESEFGEIKEDNGNRCPSCRRDYDENPDNEYRVEANCPKCKHGCLLNLKVRYGKMCNCGNCHYEFHVFLPEMIYVGT